MNIISVLLEENTRRAVRRALASGSLRAAVVPLASTEQHNEHLAMNHDARTIAWIARAAATRLFPAVVVTPVVHFGISEHWMEHPGTLTLTPQTFTQTVFEICDSLRRGGIPRIYIVNGHGGNRRPLEPRIEEFRRKLGIPIEFHSYWEAYSPEDVRRYVESGDCPGHAGEFEVSTSMAIFPESVHLESGEYPATEVHISDPSRAATDRKFFQSARLASPEKGHALLKIAVDWLESELRSFTGTV